MALNKCELRSNGIKIASFFLQKSHTGLELSPQSTPRPRLWWAWVTLVYSTHLPIYTFILFIFGLSPFPRTKSWLRANTQATASYLPIHNIFVPQKVPVSQISEDVITCNLWFGPPQLKILATPRPLVDSYMHSCNWLLSWQNKNLLGISSSRLLFSTKIQHEAMNLTFLYFGQITYKI